MYDFQQVRSSLHHKQMATLDQLGGGGRAGLNIVAGWNQPEYEAMGTLMPHEHDDRYSFAQEWADVVLAAWQEPGIFNMETKHFTLRGAESEPKPQGNKVPILNAGSSGQGRAYAAKNSDFVFTIVPDVATGAAIAATVKEQARTEFDREVGVFTLGHVVCRDTRAEAEEYLKYYGRDNADWGAVDYLMGLQGMHAQSFTPEMLATMRDRFASGHGSLPLVGTPEDVADQITALHEAGFDGMTLAFVDYVTELEYFGQKVLPILEARGVRLPR